MEKIVIYHTITRVDSLEEKKNERNETSTPVLKYVSFWKEKADLNAVTKRIIAPQARSKIPFNQTTASILAILTTSKHNFRYK